MVKSVQMPPLSPVLLAGLAARPLPPALFQPLLTLAMGATQRRYPEVFARLEPLGNTAFLINPVDLPFNFLLRPGAQPPGLTILRASEPTIAPTATISGPLLSLIGLLEGRIDGDALFFSRDLVIEGNTEAVLTLRNAVDSAEIDLVEVFASTLGPFSGAARRLAVPAGVLFRRIAQDLDNLQATLLAPATQRCDGQAAELAELRSKVDNLDRRRGRGGAKARPGDSVKEAPR